METYVLSLPSVIVKYTRWNQKEYLAKMWEDTKLKTKEKKIWTTVSPKLRSSERKEPGKEVLSRFQLITNKKEVLNRRRQVFFKRKIEGQCFNRSRRIDSDGISAELFNVAGINLNRYWNLRLFVLWFPPAECRKNVINLISNI